MKKIIKTVSILLLSLIMVLTLASCTELENILQDVIGGTITTPHTCESVCPKCGGCTDDACKEIVCADKCDCQDPSKPHACESACKECGKCTDDECSEAVCADKCLGHHACTSKCAECGKCTDKSCTESICADKCQGHHTCQNVCEQCGKCDNENCNEAVCADKCQGHHVCENVCADCGKCTDQNCDEEVCAEKCEKVLAYAYRPIISTLMPAIYINTADGSNNWATQYNQSDKLAGNIDYVDATIDVKNEYGNLDLDDYNAEVKVRGNATLTYPKKPIRIKFEKKQPLLGLHDGEKYKNWVLLADWKDLSMSNNTMAFYLSKTILGSDGYYSTDFRNVEVYLNGTFWGVYLLVEQQEVKDNRSSVPEVDDDYTGNNIGYFFEYDGYYYQEPTSYLDGGDGDPTFTMSYPSGATYRSGIGYTVKSDLYAKSQLEFLKNYLEKAFYIAYQANAHGKFYKFNADYTDVVEAPEITTAKEAVAQVIDIQSLVDTYIIHELVCDLDVDWSSFYLSLDMTDEGNKLITFEATWDKDSCFGLRNGICNDAQGLYAMSKNNPWFRLMTGQDYFNSMVCNKWREISKYGVLDGAIEVLDKQVATYEDYYIKNYEKWSSRVTQGNSECVSELNSYKDINTAQANAAGYLRRWLTKRIAYLESVWGEPIPDTEVPEGAVAYRYESEDAALAGFTVAEPIRVDKDYASGRSYVGNVAGGVSLTFTVNASSDCSAYLFAGVSKPTSPTDFNTWFSVTVNGEIIRIPVRTVPAFDASAGEEQWHSFFAVKLIDIELNEGENTIVFTATNPNANFDFIDVYSTVELT